VTRGRNERNKRPRLHGGNSGSCPVHPNSRHNASECREIIKLAKRISEQHEQASRDGSPPRRQPGKEKVDEGDTTAGEWDLGYQSPEGVLKDVFTGDSDSGTTTTAAKSCTSCTAGAGSSPPVGMYSPYAERSFRRSQGSRRLLHISGGGAPLSPSGHPTALTTWQGLEYYRSSPPLSSPTCDCTMF
jgi:hypothetical protein